MGLFISYVKARKMILKSYLYHLVQVKDSISETPTLELVSVVCEFAKVFHRDLPRIPPEREITLELVSFKITNLYLFLLNIGSIRTYGIEREVEKPSRQSLHET